jgi:pimeloyl-ACP methyl ester carboxylesterase
MKIALLLFAVLAAAVAAVFGLAYWRQELLLFAPEKLPADFSLREPDVVEETIAVDGAQLVALHLRLPDPKGVVFSLHGNAGNLASWFVDPDFYRRANFDLFMIDYRGYGKSSGRIASEAQLRRDVDAAWDQIAPRYRGRRVVVFGRSLGTALAAGLAARIRPDLTILASPYWSMRELAQLHYPLLPAGLLRYPLETWRDLQRVDGPVLLLHGDRDALIPDAHSRRLAAVARAARVQIIAGAAHGDLQEFPAYRQAIADALAAVPR